MKIIDEKPIVGKESTCKIITLSNGEELFRKLGRREYDETTRRSEMFIESVASKIHEYMGSSISYEMESHNWELSILRKGFNIEWEDIKGKNLINEDDLYGAFLAEIITGERDGNEAHYRGINIDQNSAKFFRIDFGETFFRLGNSIPNPDDNLDPDSIDKMWTAQYVESWELLEVYITRAENLPLDAIFYDAEKEFFSTTGSTTITTRQLYLSWANDLLKFAKAKQALSREALKKWWEVKRQQNQSLKE